MTQTIEAPRMPSPSAVPLRRVLAAAARSEWIKLRTVRSTIWALVLTVVVTIGLGALLTALEASRWDHRTLAQIKDFDPLLYSLAGLNLAQLSVGVLGVLAMTSEYATGSIKLTFGATPQRSVVLAAKTATFSAVVAIVGLVSCLAAFWLGQAILASKHAGVSITDPGVLRAVTGGRPPPGAHRGYRSGSRGDPAANRRRSGCPLRRFARHPRSGHLVTIPVGQRHHQIPPQLGRCRHVGSGPLSQPPQPRRRPRRPSHLHRRGAGSRSIYPQPARRLAGGWVPVVRPLDALAALPGPFGLRCPASSPSTWRSPPRSRGRTAEQIDRFRKAWADAGHADPRVSVSRSIFPLVNDLDRQYFGREGNSQDTVGFIDGGKARPRFAPERRCTGAWLALSCAIFGSSTPRTPSASDIE